MKNRIFIAATARRPNLAPPNPAPEKFPKIALRRGLEFTP
jgi:hypothetical protein